MDLDNRQEPSLEINTENSCNDKEVQTKLVTVDFGLSQLNKLVKELTTNGDDMDTYHYKVNELLNKIRYYNAKRKAR